MRGVIRAATSARVEAERRLLDLREHRARAHAQDRVGGGHEGERRADDLHAGPDAEGEQAELEGVGAGGDEQDPAPASIADRRSSTRWPKGPSPGYARQAARTASSSRSSYEGEWKRMLEPEGAGVIGGRC